MNIDAALIEQAVNDINRGKYNEVHSLLIFKDNRLVLEEYFPGTESISCPSNGSEIVPRPFPVTKVLMSRVRIRRMLAMPIHGGPKHFLIQVKE